MVIEGSKVALKMVVCMLGSGVSVLEVACSSMVCCCCMHWLCMCWEFMGGSIGSVVSFEEGRVEEVIGSGKDAGGANFISDFIFCFWLVACVIRALFFYYF